MGGRVTLSPELYAVPHLSAAGHDPFLPFVGKQHSAWPDPEIIAQSGLFDSSYYLINAGDVHEADVDPVAHFCRWGWKEHRNPNIYL